MAGRGIPLKTITRINEYAARKLRRVTMGDIMHHKSHLFKQGRVDAMVNVARWLQEELPVRYAHQLMEYYRLPYMIMMCQPVAEVHDEHLRAFEAISSFQEITSGRDVLEFAPLLRRQFQSQAQDIMLLRRGMLELQQAVSVEDWRPFHPFMDKVVVTKIGNRVLAENFVNWFECIQAGDNSLAGAGIIQRCKLGPWIRTVAANVCDLTTDIYGDCPVVSVDDRLDTEVLVLPNHLQFIMQEVLKNAVRATMRSVKAESSRHGQDDVPVIPPVHVAIRPGKYDVEIRVSDTAGGMKRRILKQIWKYGFSGPRDGGTTTKLAYDSADNTADSKLRLQLSGYGIGVPLSRLFARYFGGDLTINSVYGFGTDVSVRLNRIGDLAELGCSVVDDEEEDDRRGHRYEPTAE